MGICKKYSKIIFSSQIKIGSQIICIKSNEKFFGIIVDEF